MRRLAALLFLGALASGAELRAVEVVQPPFELSQWRLHDVDGDGRTDLLLVGAAGEVRTWALAATPREMRPRGTLTLPAPRYTLLALANLLADGGPPQLVALSPGGAVAYAAGARGAFAPAGRILARRARFRLRTNEPLFAEIVRDINRDGRPDLVVPGADATELWLNGEKGFRRAARVVVDISRSEDTKSDALSDQLVASFRVPRLVTEDVNGDGRPDLLVSTGSLRAFYLQRADGTIPAEPDVTLDLKIFRDTTPRAALRPGRTLAGSDRTRYVSRDLDADGIPDYVIAHRRKVWVFFGNRKKPQFVDPATILKVSDDLTLLLVARLDDDKFADLLLIKVQIPTLARLVMGLAGGFDIEISALGYRNRGGRAFQRTPAWRSELVVRVPPILKLMKNPGAVIAKFEDVGRKFRLDKRADLDGDGFKETLLISEDRRRLEIWRGTKETEQSETSINVDRTFRKVLFEDENRRWDFERILRFLAEVAKRRTKDLTGGGAPDATWKLRDDKRFEFLDYGVADVDGDGRAEIVVRYAPRAEPTLSIFDVIGK